MKHWNLAPAPSTWTVSGATKQGVITQSLGDTTHFTYRGDVATDAISRVVNACGSSS
jgi:hypothetical protein